MKGRLESAHRVRPASMVGAVLCLALVAAAARAVSAGTGPQACAATDGGRLYLPCLLSRPMAHSSTPTATPRPSAAPDATPSLTATGPTATGTGTATARPTPAPPAIPLLDQIGGPVYGLAPRGDFAFAAAGSRLLAIDMVDPGGPRIVGRSPVLPDLAQGVAISGDRAWVALGSAGLALLDVGDPTNPSLLATAPVPSANVHGVVVADDRAYLADVEGFVVVDIGAGGAIRVRGAVRGMGWVSGLAAAGRHVFAVGVRQRLDIYDASDPDHPVAVGSYAGAARMNDVAVAGDVLFAGGTDRLVAVDVSDPTRPREVGSVAVPAGLAVALAQDRVYASGWKTVEGLDAPVRTVTVVDRRDPAAMSVVTTLELPDVCAALGAGPRWLAVGLRAQGIRAYDLTDPALPVATGLLRLPGYVQDVFVSGGIVYAIGQGHGIWAVEAGPGQPASVIGSLPTAWSGSSIWVEGGHAYVGAAFRGLYVLDVSDPSAPTELGHLPLPDARLSSVAVAGSHAFLAGGETGLLVVDVSDPASPRQVASLAMPGAAEFVRVQAGHAYVADPTGAVVVVDLADPAAPRIVAVVTAPQDGFQPTGVALAAGHAFVAAGGSGLWVLDVARPTEPRIVGRLDRLGLASRVLVADGDAFVVDGEGLHRVDVSDPAAPAPVGYAPIGGSSRAAAAADGAVWVAALDGGLVKLER